MSTTDQPPPYSATNTPQGITNPGYTYSSEHSPPIVPSQQGYGPADSDTGYKASLGYTTAPGYANPGYTNPGYTNPGYANPGYANPGYANTGYTPSPGYSTTPGYPAPQQAPTGYSQQNQYNAPPGHSAPPKPEETSGELSGFGEKAVRRGFIRKVLLQDLPPNMLIILNKVYSILSCQLLVPGAIIAIFIFVQRVAE